MKFSFRYAALALMVPSAAVAWIACSTDTAGTEDGGTSPSSTTTSTSPSSTTTPTGTTPTPGPDGSTPDSSTPSDSGCVYVAPNTDGGGVCGTHAFGTAAVNATNAQDGGAYTGGAIAPGIYDVSLYERGSAQVGSWRETLALDGTRFTRTRQIDTGSGSGVGPVTYRSGTYAMNGQQLVLTFDCAVDGDAGSDAGSNTIVYEVVKNGCETSIRYGAAGIRTTLKRRP